MNSKIGCLFSLAYLLGIMPCFSQKFEWCKDGFSPEVTSYKNIDNSGIDIDISGLTKPQLGANMCAFGEPYVATGINNGNNYGIYHNYKFSFSEKVDVEFNILDINVDTLGRFRYNDHLVFSPSPTSINYNSSITIKGDTILPNQGNANSSQPSQLRVKFKNINSFSIQHGLGKSYNPGVIFISSLIINGDKLGLPKILDKIADKELSIFKEYSTIKNVHLITTSGQVLKPKFQSYEAGLSIIETSHIAAGMYIIYAEFSNGQVFKERFIINH